MNEKDQNPSVQRVKDEEECMNILLKAEGISEDINERKALKSSSTMVRCNMEEKLNSMKTPLPAKCTYSVTVNNIGKTYVADSAAFVQHAAQGMELSTVKSTSILVKNNRTQSSMIVRHNVSGKRTTIQIVPRIRDNVDV